MSSQSSHHPQEVFLAQFSLYVHKGSLKPDSFHFISFVKSYTQDEAKLVRFYEINRQSNAAEMYNTRKALMIIKVATHCVYHVIKISNTIYSVLYTLDEKNLNGYKL